MLPAWLLDILVAVILVVAAVSAIRLATVWLPANRLSAAEPTGFRSSPRASRGADADIAHLLMGIAMAGMLAPGVKTLPPHAWEVIFGLLTAWFTWRLVDDTRVNALRSPVSGHRAPHLFHCAAMVYMTAAWPMVARAQQPSQMRRVGILMGLPESDPDVPPRIAAFREGLRKLGWTEGVNIQLEFRWAPGDGARARAFAAELVSLKPDAILARWHHPSHWCRRPLG
jgi:hypothetical protein